MSKASAGLLACVLVLGTGVANAALFGRAPLTPGGTDYQAYYDDVLNITWVADANLAKTSGYDADGLMTWTVAQAWIAALNVQNGGLGYLGVKNWRLPKVTDTGISGCDFAYSGTDCGYNVDLATGEMARMFYGTLGNTGFYDTGGGPAGCAYTNVCLTSTSPFTNLQPDYYWYGSVYVPSNSVAWNFSFFDGNQNFTGKTFNAYAWAVRTGDIGLAVQDADGDGVADDVDNCVNVYNPNQLDSDGDGYGNACDPDLNNSGKVTSVDFSLLRSVLNQLATASPLAAAADLNGSGRVTVADYAILRSYVTRPPGPSGLHPLCPPTCP